MTQRPIEMQATALSAGGDVLQVNQSGLVATRRALVSWVDSVLAWHGLSGRARRQVDLVRAWRVVQAGKAPRWRIEATESCGKAAVITFEVRRA